MTALSLRLILALATSAALLASVHGHGFLMKPKTAFSTYGGGYSAIVQSSTLTPPAGKKFIWYQDQIAGIFESALKPTQQSLRDFILTHQDTFVQAKGAPKPLSAACGFSNPRGAPQALPDKLEWEMNFQHPGPCEVYCDKLAVPYTTDCWATYTDARIPYNHAKCVGKKQLALYFLAVHYPPWQVYINCVPLAGATSNSSGNNSKAPATPTPVVTTLKPSRAPVPSSPPAPTKASSTAPQALSPAPSKDAATKAPSSTTAPSLAPRPAISTPAPEAPTEPATTSQVPGTPTPSSGSTVCKTKARRRQL